MKQFKFQISLPSNHTRTYVFYDREAAEEKHKEYKESDPRFDPSEIEASEMKSNAIVVDRNNKYVEHDLTGLNLVGSRQAHQAGVIRDERWYCVPGKENEVEKELQKAKMEMNASYREKTLGLSSILKLG